MTTSSALAKKIVAVMATMGAVAKDEQHPQKYKYQSHEAVMDALRPALIAQSVALTSQMVGLQEAAGHWVAEFIFTLTDAETGETLASNWFGVAPHQTSNGYTDDKALGKATTYALKTFILKTFLVSSKDDVDLDANHEAPATPPRAGTRAGTAKKSNAAHWSTDPDRVKKLIAFLDNNGVTLPALLDEFDVKSMADLPEPAVVFTRVQALAAK